MLSASRALESLYAIFVFGAQVGNCVACPMRRSGTSMMLPLEKAGGSHSAISRARSTIAPRRCRQCCSLPGAVAEQQGKDHSKKELFPGQGGPCKIASTPCFAPVISLFWHSGKILQMSLSYRKSRNNLSHLAGDRPRHMAILPVFLPVSRETTNRDGFADDCLHRTDLLLRKGLRWISDPALSFAYPCAAARPRLPFW
jgi:hypothetical protein